MSAEMVTRRLNPKHYFPKMTFHALLHQYEQQVQEEVLSLVLPYVTPWGEAQAVGLLGLPSHQVEEAPFVVLPVLMCPCGSSLEVEGQIL